MGLVNSLWCCGIKSWTSTSSSKEWPASPRPICHSEQIYSSFILAPSPPSSLILSLPFSYPSIHPFFLPSFLPSFLPAASNLLALLQGGWQANINKDVWWQHMGPYVWSCACKCYGACKLASVHACVCGYAPFVYESVCVEGNVQCLCLLEQSCM